MILRPWSQFIYEIFLDNNSTMVAVCFVVHKFICQDMQLNTATMVAILLKRVFSRECDHGRTLFVRQKTNCERCSSILRLWSHFICTTHKKKFNLQYCCQSFLDQLQVEICQYFGGPILLRVGFFPPNQTSAQK